MLQFIATIEINRELESGIRSKLKKIKNKQVEYAASFKKIKQKQTRRAKTLAVGTSSFKN